MNIVKRVVQICSNSCTEPRSVDSALIQFHAAMDCSSIISTAVIPRNPLWNFANYLANYQLCDVRPQ